MKGRLLADPGLVELLARDAVTAQAPGGHGPQDVPVLGGAVELARAVVAGDPVGDVAGDLYDGHARHEDVDAQAHLDAPAVGERRGGLVGPAGQAALPGQGGDGGPAGGRGDGGARGAHDPAPPAGSRLLGRRGDRHVRDAVDHRGDEVGAGRGRVAQVGVDEEQQAGGPVLVVAHGDDAGAGLQGGGLAAGHRVAHGDGPGGAGVVLSGVDGAVVDDDDEVDARNGAAGANGGSDAGRLVLGWNDDGDALVWALGRAHRLQRIHFARPARVWSSAQRTRSRPDARKNGPGAPPRAWRAGERAPWRRPAAGCRATCRPGAGGRGRLGTRPAARRRGVGRDRASAVERRRDLSPHLVCRQEFLQRVTAVFPEEQDPEVSLRPRFS